MNDKNIDTFKPPIKKKRLSVNLLCGAIAGVIGTTVIFPMDIVKTRLQNQTNNEYKGIIDCFKQIIRKDGFRGLYRGLLANLVGVSPEKAIKLAVNDYSRNWWADRMNIPEEKLPLTYGMISGATAGFCQVVATNPMEIVKINMQLASKNSNGLKTTTMDVIRSLGLKGLYRGSVATLCRDVPFSFLFFPSVSLLKNMAPRNPDGSLPFYSVFISGIISAGIAAGIVTPMDVVKTRLQVNSKTPLPYKNMLECYKFILKKQGISGLFQGVVPRVLIVSPLFAITILIYEVQQRRHKTSEFSKIPNKMASENLFSAEQIKIPAELPEIMKNYTKFIIKTQPQNIISASAEYFSRLSKQTKTSGGDKKFDKIQLESFYGKYKSGDKKIIAVKDISATCEELGISASQLSDILTVGKLSGDNVSWLKVWSFLLAASAGTLSATIELLADVAGDNGFIGISIVKEVITILTEQDSSIDSTKIATLLSRIEDVGTNEIDKESLIELVHEILSIK